jgi:hypothetical protein
MLMSPPPNPNKLNASDWIVSSLLGLPMIVTEQFERVDIPITKMIR